MLSWGDEMSKMLAAFEQQAKFSLTNIGTAFKRDGLSFSAQFKQYFLQASNNRIKETYDQFEIDSVLEGLVVDADASKSATDEYLAMGSIYSPNYDRSKQQERNGSVEIIDSSDEEDQTGSEMKLESFSPILDDDYDMLLKLDVMKADDGIPELVNDVLCDMKTTSACTYTGASNFDDGAKGNSMTGTPTECARKRASGSIAKMSPNKMSTSSKPMGTKKRFQCEFCAYSSNYKADLKKHTRTHTGEKPYRCDICSRGFATMQPLKKHKVTHVNEFPFHCRGCFSGFSQKIERDGHGKVCKLRRYECHVCKKFVTANKNQLKVHMRKHNGKKPFRCEICMKRFTQKGSLKTHLVTIHGSNY